MASEYKRSRDYELMVIFHPELSEEDVAGESDRVQGYLTTAEAAVTHVNRDAPWGRRRLAYPIRHGGRDLRDGIYALYYFNAEPGRIEDVEREIKLSDRIIRYLLTQQIAPIAEPEVPESEDGVTPPEAAAPATPTADAPASDAIVEAAEVEEPAAGLDIADAATTGVSDEQVLEPAPEEVPEPVAKPADGESTES